jgi:hypothetical protein
VKNHTHSSSNGFQHPIDACPADAERLGDLSGAASSSLSPEILAGARRSAPADFEMIALYVLG